MTHEHTFRAFVKNVAAAGVGTMAALALLEAVLALVLPPPLHYRYPQPLHRPDRELGWVLIPGQHSYTIDEEVRINALGFRSPELAAPRSGARLRVLCLGDSQTFGNGVAQDRTYPMRLESWLRSADPDRPIQVINAGVQAYDTVQEVDLLERVGSILQPDVVTIGFYINDVGEVLRQGHQRLLVVDTGEFERRGLIKSLTPYRLIYLAKRSRLVTLVTWWLVLLGSRAEDNLEYQMLLGNTPTTYEEGWRRIEAALTRAKALAERRKFRLIVFPIPAYQEFRGDYPREQYRSRLAAIAARHRIEYLDPTPVLRTSARPSASYFIAWDGHISAEAHDTVAQLIAGALASSPGIRPGSGPRPDAP